MYNRYIRRDDGTYTKVAEPDPPRQETTGPGSQPSPPPPDDPNESGPRSGGPPPSFGGTEGLAGYLRRILDQLHLIGWTPGICCCWVCCTFCSGKRRTRSFWWPWVCC